MDFYCYCFAKSGTSFIKFIIIIAVIDSILLANRNLFAHVYVYFVNDVVMLSRQQYDTFGTNYKLQTIAIKTGANNNCHDSGKS